jgi:predicted Fe-Mo cluster-binding NifX family protein
MSIKVAVTAQNRRTISNHAGSCRNYHIYTIDEQGNFTKELIELAIDESLKFTFHDDTSLNPTNYIFGMDYLLTQGIGQGGVNRLAAQNVTALVINETDPDVAIQKFIDKTLDFLQAENHHKDDHHTCHH